ncbi:P-loop containing protein [Fusarium pseudoanthophilum]|uniref:P-loop containing protein n=1 Tax=Fusarium pseudoanthophilum TaxID=48495 RepID=A0A8H5NMG8_9HYPO|nr:P-loop containing protein [Fusarium pseudoanthophilum]
MGSSAESVASQPLHPHLKLLDHEVEMASTMKSVPLFTHNIEARLPIVERPAQYGLLASNISGFRGSSSLSASTVEHLRSRLFYNVAAPVNLMAVSSIQGGGLPLYLHVVSRILRDMRIAQQQTNSAFDYKAFKTAIGKESLTEGQLLPLQQRLQTLESFMVTEQTLANGPASRLKAKPTGKGNTPAQGVKWDLIAGELTIVDLSCPCVTAETACSLFNICLSLFLEREPTIGRIVALDEAHKYMRDSSDSQTLTESLLSVIRLQRHLGTRVILSTQEPTISPKLLDLCSTVIVHRFTSPTWFATLRRHLAGVYLVSEAEKKICGQDMVNSTNTKKDSDALGSFSHLNIKDEDLFSYIVSLETGEALLFCPNALIGIGAAGASNSIPSLIQLGSSTMKVRIRKRITADGGQSIMAN